MLTVTGHCLVVEHAGQLSQFQALGGSLLEATEDPSQPYAPPASATRHTRNVIACAHTTPATSHPNAWLKTAMHVCSLCVLLSGSMHGSCERRHADNLP